MGVTIEDYRKRASAKYNAMYKGASNVLYSVQIGAYTKRENAEKALANAKKAGFSAFIKETTQ
jgi:cell division septation protein DedD